MYGRLASAFGWTYEYIGTRVTLPIVVEMFRYLEKYPPVNETFAMFVGVGDNKAERPSNPPLSELQRTPGVTGGDPELWRLKAQFIKDGLIQPRRPQPSMISKQG